MRSLLLLCLLILVVSCQKNVIANFDIHIENSDQYDDRPHDLYKIEIYKDEKIFKILEPEEFAPALNFNIKLDSLKEGKYSFVYENLFGEKIEKEIKIDDSKTYRISINPDILINKNKKSVFENLKDSEAKLVFQSIGCYHQDKDSIVIINKDNNYFLRQKNGSLKPLDKEVWAYLVKSENRIREIPKGGDCTTRDKYVFYYKGKSDTINDSTCKFSTWYTLRDYLKKNKLK